MLELRHKYVSYLCFHTPDILSEWGLLGKNRMDEILDLGNKYSLDFPVPWAMCQRIM